MSNTLNCPTNPDLHNPPASATHGAVALMAVLSFGLATAWVRHAGLVGGSVVLSASLIMALTALAVMLTDLGWGRVHRRRSTGLDFAKSNPSWERTSIKWLGLAGTGAVIGLGYWLLPEYHGTFYGRYFALMRAIVPLALIAAVPYIYFIDRYQREPVDGYFYAGQFFLGRYTKAAQPALKQHALGWLIKAFFLPLMFTYFCNDLERLIARPTPTLSDFTAVYNFLYDSMYFVDVGLVSMGYLLALRLTDTHLRSAESTVSGWAVTLVCYEPFWSLIGDRYLAYGSGHPWGWWLAAHPWLYTLWGSLILLLTGIYVWATVSFGARFSNLTHRGIITNGPYRYLCHPAYWAKNLSWWMISVPFLVTDSTLEALRHCLCLLGLNAIYALRALTEERHLKTDSDYRDYHQWIQKHGIYPRLLRGTGLSRPAEPTKLEVF